MTGTEMIAPVALDGSTPVIDRLGMSATAGQAGSASFQSILYAGLDSVDRKVADADALVRQFALDDSVPVHQVTIALEEARLSVELMMQVRARLVETYRELMNMQL